MKIGIITVHFGVNYGSALQAYALSNFITENKWNITPDDFSVELINYIPSRYSVKNRYLNLNRKMSIVRRIPYSVASAPSQFIYHKIFDGFLKTYSPLGKELYSIGELTEHYGNYDLLIAGSDQIWNSDYNDGFDNAYFLSFASDRCVKCTYAASCGKLEFDADETEKMKKALASFSGISVREKQGQGLVKSMGFSDVPHVLDPIFLFDKKRWGNLAGNQRIISEKYLFIYLLDEDTNSTVNVAVKIAKKLNLKTVMVSFGHIWSKDDRVDYYMIQKSPSDFINLMINSDYVVTNSFHGVAFSINFNKQFYAFKRAKYNSRLESIADMFLLQNRFLDSNGKYDADSLLEDSIDYSKVNELMDSYRKSSVDYLESMIDKAYETSK